MDTKNLDIQYVFKTANDLIEAADHISNQAPKELKSSVYYYFTARYLVAVYEAIHGEIPIQVWNEYRNALDHYFRSITSRNEQSRIKQIDRMERHLQRAVLDIGKLLCHKSSDRLTHALNSENISILNKLDDGNFLKDILQKQNTAQKLFIESKISDVHLGHDVDIDKHLIEKYLHSAFAFLNITSDFNHRRADIAALKNSDQSDSIRELRHPIITNIAGTLIKTQSGEIYIDGYANGTHTVADKNTPIISSEHALRRIANTARFHTDQLRSGIQQAREESKKFFYLTCISAGIGLAVILLGVVLMYVGTVTPGAVTTAVGALSQIITFLLLKKDQELRKTVEINNNHLLWNQRLVTMIDVAETIGDESAKNSIKTEIVTTVIKSLCPLGNQDRKP